MKTTWKTEQLKTVVDRLSFLVSDVVMDFTEEGMLIDTVDPSHVAMIHMVIPKDDFVEYESGRKIGMDIDKLKEVLKITRKSEEIPMTFDTEKNRLIFDLGNIRRTTMPLDKNAAASLPKVPEMEWDTVFVIEAEELLHGLKAVESISDFCKIMVKKDGHVLMAAYDENDEVEIMLGETEAGGEVIAMFPLDFLKPAIFSITGTVKLSLRSDYPLGIEFDNGFYVIAPRIEE